MLGEWRTTRASRTPEFDGDEGSLRSWGWRGLPRRLAALGRMFRRTAENEDVLPEIEPPSVIIACTECGFNYRIEKIDFGQGRIGAFWMCACGSRYIPPGGEQSFHLLRP